MNGLIKKLVKRVPKIRAILEENESLKAELKKRRTRWMPGHFYSPIPDLDEARREQARIPAANSAVLGVALNEHRQIELLSQLGRYHDDAPFPEEPEQRFRYHYRNTYYAHADGIVLHTMLRHLKPRRVIEVGSGFSSAMVLDTNELFLSASIDTTFIDPHADRLKQLLRERERDTSTIIEAKVQDVPTERFMQLERGDMLIIDSSHVSKAGSELNHLLFEVVPGLQSGVLVHFHDVFYPFDYPLGWIEDGVAWNEAYLLRAFLQYNSQFSLTFFTSMMMTRHRELMQQHLPTSLRSEVPHPSLRDTPGSSVWITRN